LIVLAQPFRRASMAWTLFGRDLRGHRGEARQHGFGLLAALGALYEAAAIDAGVVAVVAVERAGLAGRDAGFTLAELDPDRAVAVMQHRRARRPRRTDLGIELNAFGWNVGQRIVAQPVDVAQVDLVRLQRLARA